MFNFYTFWKRQGHRNRTLDSNKLISDKENKGNSPHIHHTSIEFLVKRNFTNTRNYGWKRSQNKTKLQLQSYGTLITPFGLFVFSSKTFLPDQNNLLFKMVATSVISHYYYYCIIHLYLCDKIMRLPSKHLLVLKTSSTLLQRNNFLSSKTSRRRLEDILQEVLKASWRRLKDISCRRLEYVMETNKKFTNDICI